VDYDLIYPDDGSFDETSDHNIRTQGATSQIQEHFNIQKCMNLYPNLQTHNKIQVQPHYCTSDKVACKIFQINRNMGDKMKYVGYATTNKCYNEQFLSIKPGCYNEHGCYNERGRILSADVVHACA
jgi:hypothetical protein